MEPTSSITCKAVVIIGPALGAIDALVHPASRAYGAGDRRKIRRGGTSGYISIVSRVNGYTASRLGVHASQVRGILQCGSLTIELSYKNIPENSTVHRLN